MGKEYVVALRESLEKKIKVLDEIIRIGELQSELLEKEELDYDAFDELMNNRDLCLDKLDKLDEGFEIVYNNLSDDIKAHQDDYGDEIKKMQSLIKDITDKSTAIAAMDSRNKSAVDNAFVKSKRGLSEGKRSVSVAMNYYKSMNGLSAGSDSRYMDSKK